MTEDVYPPRSVKRKRRTNAELDAIDDAIVDALTRERPATLRGVYYRVVSAGMIEKTESAYKVISRQLVKLRREGRVPYRWVTDGTRYITRPQTHDDMDAALVNTAATYRRALWNDQDAEVHVLTEKDAIKGVVQSVTMEWQVPLGILRGYSSETFCQSVAEEVDDCGKREVFVYQLGDHDPSGVDAWRSFERKVADFLDAEEDGSDADSTTYVFDDDREVTFERLAVTPAQIRDMGLLTRPTKKSDTRAASFTGESVEVDAVPASELRTIVEEAITRHIDVHALDVTRAAEESERDLLDEMSTAGFRSLVN
jgi:hypothetical protein